MQNYKKSRDLPQTVSAFFDCFFKDVTGKTPRAYLIIKLNEKENRGPKPHTISVPLH